MNALVALENQLTPLAPQFQQVLPANVKPDRLIRTVIVSVERLPKLLECDRQSLFNAAMSAAILGLEVDGVTGQAYLIPFKGKAQLVVGYKGYNTIAARSGITIAGAVVREGDTFDYELGSSGYVRHIPTLGNKGRIIGAWATATHSSRPPVVHVMGIDELMAVKGRSPGAQRQDSPWNDPAIGFPAMCEKTVKRRLARSLPMNMMQAAARMDEAVDEQGLPARIDPERGVVVDGEVIAEREPSPTPTAQELISPQALPEPPAPSRPAPPAPSEGRQTGAGVAAVPTWEDYVDRWAVIIAESDNHVQLGTEWNKQKDLRNKILWPDDDGRAFGDLRARVEGKINLLKYGR